jgi:hypothetical protein
MDCAQNQAPSAQPSAMVRKPAQSILAYFGFQSRHKNCTKCAMESTRKPSFTLLAWLSLIIPLVAAGWGYFRGSAPAQPDVPGGLSKADLIVLAFVFAAGLLAGLGSLWGVRTNGAWHILPPALLGILVSAILEGLALIFLILSNLPGP